MKRSILLFSALLFPMLALAAPAPSLKDNMKSIGTIVKALQKSVDDKTQNAASATQAHQLVGLFTAVQSQVPDSIAKMQPKDQAAALADYKAMIQQEITDAQRLETAYATNDNGAASKIIDEMLGGKSDGHKKYK